MTLAIRPVGWHPVKQAFGRVIEVQFLIRKRKASRTDLVFALNELIEETRNWLDAIETAHKPVTDGELHEDA